MDPIVEFIASQPGMIERLITEHRPDQAGRCAVCSSGPQAGRVRWPCPTYGYANRARSGDDE